MPKWEYCVITGIQITLGNGFDGYYPKLRYFSLGGVEKIIDLGNHGKSQRPKGVENFSEGSYIAYTIAQLGMDGWEMVNIVSTGNGKTSADTSHCIYFKRLIE